MKNCPICLTTRREFLRSTLLGGALSWTVPSFFAQTLATLHLNAQDSLTQVATGKDNPILVILQMAGGNDGLNTIVPYANDFYYAARPTLAHKADTVIKLNDEVGLAPTMTGFKSLFDDGHLSLIQGVGYPNPNRSHFRSTEIWQTASDSNVNQPYGWVGRYFDNACPGADPTVGVALGNQLPQSFSSPHPTGVTLNNPQNYRFATAETNAGDSVNTENIYRQLNGMEEPAADPAAENSGGSIAAVAGSSGQNGSPLDFLERTALDAQVSSDKILKIIRNSQNQAVYPASGLANNLKLIARLIAGGLPTRVFYLSQGGYDTHNNQTNAHGRLLKELADSMKAFRDDLKAQGNLDRVVLMTFSEFGRRVHENGSQGTDHGTAAPLFLMGGKIQAGVHGTLPSLAPQDLDTGDLVYKTDFRSIYSTLLEGCLKTSSTPILGRSFPTLNLLT